MKDISLTPDSTEIVGTVTGTLSQQLHYDLQTVQQVRSDGKVTLNLAGPTGVASQAQAAFTAEVLKGRGRVVGKPVSFGLSGRGSLQPS